MPDLSLLPWELASEQSSASVGEECNSHQQHQQRRQQRQQWPRQQRWRHQRQRALASATVAAMSYRVSRRWKLSMESFSVNIYKASCISREE